MNASKFPDWRPVSRRPLLWFILATVLFPFPVTISSNAAPDSGPHVVQFTPQGTVKGVRQVTARFSDPMIPFGDPRGLSPFDIDCAKQGTGRWLDNRNWSYDFKEDLPAGISCNFRLRKGLKTLAGAIVTAPKPEFNFSTGGPSIVSTSPYREDNQIDEEQAFVLTLDAEVQEPSVLEHASFSVEGLPEPIGVSIISGDNREKILKTVVSKEERSAPIVIIQAVRPFPDATEVSLVWGKGIASKTGVLTDEDQVLKFKTRPAFTADFRCERVSANAGCVPLTPMRLAFSSSVSWEQAQHIELVGPNNEHHSPEPRSDASPSVENVEFRGPFKESASFQLTIPGDLRDDIGRTLSNANLYPLTIKTDSFPPLAKFSSRFGILESADPVLPVTVRNLEPEIAGDIMAAAGLASRRSGFSIGNLLQDIQARFWRVPLADASHIQKWLLKVAAAKREDSVFEDERASQLRQLRLPRPNGAKAFEVIGIPLKRPGLYIVELKSQELGSVLLGEHKAMYVPAAALVTNMSVHLKWGRERSLVWVTTLDKAQPVNAAEVAVHDCTGKVLWSGSTDSQGIAWINQPSGNPRKSRFFKRFRPEKKTVQYLPTSRDLPSCSTDTEFDSFAMEGRQINALRGLTGGLFVTAQKGEDLSFVHSSWDDGIESWRFRLPSVYDPGEMAAHTVLDRPLFRAGETVHMKHFIRRKTLSGFSAVDAAHRPTTLSIRHSATNQQYDFPLTWSDDGSAESTWQVPKDAKLGRYGVVLLRTNPKAKDSEEESPEGLWQSAEFRIEEFRVPLMKATLQFPSAAAIAVDQLPVDINVQYLSGGPAKSLPVIFRSQIQSPLTLDFPEFPDFAFATGAIKEGVIRSGEQEFESENAQGEHGVHQKENLTLDSGGSARAVVGKLPHEERPLPLLAEVEFRDPNGEAQTVSHTTTLWPAKWLAGVHTDDWVSTRNTIRAQIAVVDDAGHPIPKTKVTADLFERKMYSNRKRIVGGFYSYENITETKRLSQFCQGSTDDRGILNCEGPPPYPGNFVIAACVTDNDGHKSCSSREAWVPGKPEWFAGRDDDRIDLLPEKTRYEPGDMARFQVRMPFREATALVTIEREGVRHASVVHLSGSEPVIHVPIRDYAPNIFVSALVVRGRVGDVQPTAMVDLGKPAFKLGIAEIKVGWRDHELNVKVTPDREVHHIREKASVKVAVRTADGKAPPAGSEVAIAAVDQGLLELAPNESWKLLDAMMGERGYEVATSTAQMQVVGKRHYGLKALAQGGGGGRGGPTRELFETLLLWRARVALDSNGDATVEIPLNDSLTSFKIVAVASSGLGSFGTGSATIRSTQDLMVLSGLAPLVRSGDTFESEFTIHNATDKPLDVDVQADVAGLKEPLSPIKLSVGAGEAKVAEWNLTAPDGIDQLKYTVAAVAGSNGPRDKIAVTQKVIPVVPVRTYQATLRRLDHSIDEQVAIPTDAIPGRGGLLLAESPTLTVGLGSVREWMRNYPYGCLEQEVSRAVALGDSQRWQALAETLPSYQDSDGMLKFFPNIDQGSDSLTSYVLSITKEAGLALPAPVETSMVTALQKFVDGSLKTSPSFFADLTMRKLSALQALSRVGKADPKALSSITIEPNLWPTSSVIDFWSILARTPAIQSRERLTADTEQILRSRLHAEGTTLNFSSKPFDNLWWLMVVPENSELRLILLLLETNQWHDDLPRLMTGSIARQSRGAWPTTITNAWGTLALTKFSHVMEATPVTGQTSGTLTGKDSHKIDLQLKPDGAPLNVPWMEGPAQLQLQHSGTGAPWLTMQSQAAIPLKTELFNGVSVTKTIKAIEPAEKGTWHRGDIAEIRIEVDTEGDASWLVVNDPIPAGASHLGTGLARDSQIMAEPSQQASGPESLWPSYEERAFDGYRAYYEFVPKGKFVVTHIIRLNQSGEFQLPATRVEALYQPGMFGEIPNATIVVKP